jgi:hypothetical protein
MKAYDDMKREFSTPLRSIHASVPHLRGYADTLVAYFEDDREVVRRLLPVLEVNFEEAGIDAWIDAYSIAGFYFYLGENDKGFEWLERSYSRNEGALMGKDGSLMGIAADPDLDGVRTDPRYLDLVKRLGLE